MAAIDKDISSLCLYSINESEDLGQLQLPAEDWELEEGLVLVDVSAKDKQTASFCKANECFSVFMSGRMG